jgi:hypothetical protein
MKSIAADSVKATFTKLDPEKRDFCFEVIKYKYKKIFLHLN